MHRIDLGLAEAAEAQAPLARRDDHSCDEDLDYEGNAGLLSAERASRPVALAAVPLTIGCAARISAIVCAQCGPVRGWRWPERHCVFISQKRGMHAGPCDRVGHSSVGKGRHDHLRSARNCEATDDENEPPEPARKDNSLWRLMETRLGAPRA